jgi:hypothetical protein
MYLGRINNNHLKIARTAFKEHMKWYRQEKHKKFVTPEWKKEWLSMYPQPLEHFLKMFVGDIEKLKNEIAEKVLGSLILKDLENFIPKKLSGKKHLEVMSLLRDIINISDLHKRRGYTEAINNYERRLDSKDPKKLLEMRKEELCNLAFNLQDSNEGWTHSGKQMQTMKDMEVLRIANGENKYSIISKEEFEKMDAKGESAIFGYYNTWKSRKRKRKIKPAIK